MCVCVCWPDIKVSCSLFTESCHIHKKKKKKKESCHLCWAYLPWGIDLSRNEVFPLIVWIWAILGPFGPMWCLVFTFIHLKEFFYHRKIKEAQRREQMEQIKSLGINVSYSNQSQNGKTCFLALTSTSYPTKSNHSRVPRKKKRPVALFPETSRPGSTSYDFACCACIRVSFYFFSM